MPVEPNIQLNFLAIIVAILVSMVIGFQWSGPIFGKIWAKEMKMPPEFRPLVAMVPMPCMAWESELRRL